MLLQTGHVKKRANLRLQQMDFLENGMKLAPIIGVDAATKLRRVFLINRGIRAYDRNRRETRLRGPLSVQIQTIDRCNGACVMCPYSDSDNSGLPTSMEEGLYTKILDELRSAGTVCSFSPMLQNEPLLDRDIAKRVRDARGILGETALVYIVTNGLLLSPEKAGELLEATIDTIHVSIDAFREETYRSIRKGLDFSRVVDNVHSVLNGERGPKVVVRFLRQRANQGEEKAFMHYWKDRGAGTQFHSVVNRAGTVDSFDQLMGTKPKLIRRLTHSIFNRMFPFCPLPFFSLNVLCDGRVLLCCHDWSHSVIVGDLKKQSLPAIWNSERINHYRNLLFTNRSKEIPCCSNCTYAHGLWSSKTESA